MSQTNEKPAWQPMTRLITNAGNDSIYGGNGNDSINAGAGNDLLDGGTGNDTYIVDSTADVVTESNALGWY